MGDAEATRIVKGEIVLPPDVPTASANVVVRVEDVSRADAPSTVVGEQRRIGVPIQGGAVIPFAVEVPAQHIDERHSYSVRVHIDMSGSGAVEAGDLVSVQTYPVLTRGHGTEARVVVRRV